MSNEVLLETENLVKTFGTFRAVDGLNLQVRAGEMVGLVGPDGAGQDDCHPLDVRRAETHQRNRARGRL